MQIHELNGFTGTLSDAYLAVDDGADTGKRKVNDVTAPLDARIDNIIAGGTAPSAAEVTDARLGANGVVYPSLGDAIRDQITDVNNDISLFYKPIDITNRFLAQAFINLGGGVGSTAPITSPSTNSGCSYLVIGCKKGDKIKVTAAGGNNSRAWAVLDTSKEILAVAAANETVTDFIITAPQDGYFVVNTFTTEPHTVLYQFSKSYILDNLENNIYQTTKDITKELVMNYIYNLSGGVGSTLPAISASGGFYCLLKSCKAGDSLLVTALGGNNARAWAILDSNKTILTVSKPNESASNQLLYAEVDGYFVVNANGLYPKEIKYTSSTIDSILSDVDNATNHTEIVLPENIYGVIGQEFDLYKDNALLYGDVHSVARVRFVDNINNYIEDNKRFTGTPSVTRSQYPQFSLYKDTIKTRALFHNLHLIISDPAVLNGLTRKILVIGDSKVAGGRLPQVLKILCTNAGMNVGKLLGSVYISNFDVNCEGRSGWSSSDYMASSKGGVSNPFYNSGFDFSYYMTQQGYTSMDYVFINLGTNDYANSSGLGSDAYINTFITNIESMINSIHSYNSNIKVIIGLAEGVCTSQYSDMSSEYLDSLNTRARLLNKACIEQWDNNAHRSNKVYVCPLYLSMDMENDYLMSEVPLSQWDSEYNTGKTMYKVTDLMHQSAVGYAKNATYMFSLLTYLES